MSDQSLSFSASETFSASNSAVEVGQTTLLDKVIHTLNIGGVESLCLAQISALLLSKFSYNEIHNRRVALGISCSQCTPSQLELLRKAGALPATSRRCGMITRTQAERLVRSFLCPAPPPALPETFTFRVRHDCAFGCSGLFYPSRYNSSRAKCIMCIDCKEYLSPNKFVFHSHQQQKTTAMAPATTAVGLPYKPVNAANFNSWRKHVTLNEKADDPKNAGLDLSVIEQLWEDIKSVFNGGVVRKQQTNKRAADDEACADCSEEVHEAFCGPLDVKPALSPDLLQKTTALFHEVNREPTRRNVQVKRRRCNKNLSGDNAAKASPAANMFVPPPAQDQQLNFQPLNGDLQMNQSAPHFSFPSLWQPFATAPFPLGSSSILLQQLYLLEQNKQQPPRFNNGPFYTPPALAAHGAVKTIDGTMEATREQQDSNSKFRANAPLNNESYFGNLTKPIVAVDVPLHRSPQHLQASALLDATRISAFSRCSRSLSQK